MILGYLYLFAVLALIFLPFIMLGECFWSFVLADRNDKIELAYAFIELVMSIIACGFSICLLLVFIAE